MADRPIIFSAPMVRALLEGRKSMTRRVLKPQPHQNAAGLWVAHFGKRGLFQTTADQVGWSFLARGALPYAPGDRLWVKHSADCFPVYFKQIPFGAGKYAVGTDGRVYARSDSGWENRAVRISHNGYEEISLRYNGEQRPFRVNRLVAEAFYGAAPEGYVCRHMDGSRRNNRPENLDWGTPEQNSADASAAGSFSGERASKAKLSGRDVDAIIASAERQAVIADRFGITQPTVSKIKSGKRWARPGEAPPRNMPAFQLWRSPIFCPRWASRLTLVVTEVRVQRLQDISEADAVAEGAPRELAKIDAVRLGATATHKAGFQNLWDSLHGPEAWDANPWAAAISFTVHKANIDNMEAPHGHD